jgi:hypothetical protein
MEFIPGVLGQPEYAAFRCRFNEIGVRGQASFIIMIGVLPVYDFEGIRWKHP